MTTTLPTLAGTDKQVEWANSIRRETIEAAETLIGQLARSAANKPGQDHIRDAATTAINTYISNTIREHADAKWWIDNRWTTQTGIKDAARNAAHAANRA